MKRILSILYITTLINLLISGVVVHAMDDFSAKQGSLEQGDKQKSHSTQKNVGQLVDNISEMLVTKKLSFNSPVPQELYEFFQSGTFTAHEILTKKDANRLPTLHRIQQKAEELHQTGALTSLWLLHLNLGCAELLSFESEVNELEPSYITLGGDNIEDGFERFSYLHEHRHDLKKPYICKQLENQHDFEYVFGSGKGSFTLSGNYFRSIDCLIERRTCFWLPVMVKNALIPIKTLNKAYAHRIGLVGIPFENEDYDGNLNETPKSFGRHDAGHARVFNTEESIDVIGTEQNYAFSTFEFLDFSNDPWMNFWHQVWQTLDKSSLDNFLFFDLFHETAATSILREYQFNRKSPNLPEFIALSLEWNKRYETDFSSPEAYWRSRLQAVGITEVTTIISHRLQSTLDDAYTIYYGLPNQTELVFFMGMSNYALDKAVTKNWIPYIRRLGAPIGSEIDTMDERFGIAYYKYLQASYMSFLSRQGYEMTSLQWNDVAASISQAYIKQYLGMQ